MKYDVFISHSSADLELSETIYDYLQEQGIKCWIDSRNVTGLYARSIIEGIEESELMVLIYSGKANSSAHVENEIDNAFCLGKTIIPFRIEGAPYSTVLRYYLNKSHYVDGMPEPLEVLERLRDQIIRNLSEQKKQAQIEDALKVVAEWVGVDIETLCLTLKQLKTKEQIDRSSDMVSQKRNNAFDKNLKEFVESELSTETPEGDQEGSSSEGRYDLLRNAKGEVLLIIDYKDSAPEDPRLVYDGGKECLLYRNRENSVIMENIAEMGREALLKADEILVVEVKDDDVEREYKVPLRKVKALQNLF